ncbi:TPA: DNA repair exonuclease [Candidatus Bathyarchaeota archaeon]|nr:DNA repair exonuclease [Candidatus Bathyarchaeota archaeon]
MVMHEERRSIRPFSFVHVADTHLGYRQYGLVERWEDFARAFDEVVDRTIELKPEFMIISGDVFHDPRPTNRTLEAAIRDFMRLKDEGVEVIVTGGSHDSSPNVTTGTILKPLDSAKLLRYLPAHEGGCYREDGYYVYGIPNFRTRREAERHLEAFYKGSPPRPDPSVFNICVFHMAIDHPSVPRIPKEYLFDVAALPRGFDYYAGGHVHKPVVVKLGGEHGGAILAYSGCIETASLKDVEYEKGFYHVTVDEHGRPRVDRVRLKSPRRFEVVEVDGTGKRASEITRLGCDVVRQHDGEGKVIILVLTGVLPDDVRKVEIDLAEMRGAAKKALCVRVKNDMVERRITEEVKRRIIERKPEDLMRRAYEYMVSVLRATEREDVERIAKIAVDLIGPLKRGEKRRVRELLERL